MIADMHASVRIASRYGEEREMKQLRKLAERLPPELISEVIERFADSKSGVYFVDARSVEVAERIALAVPPLRVGGLRWRGEVHPPAPRLHL
jgi:hypothetical protein